MEKIFLCRTAKSRSPALLKFMNTLKVAKRVDFVVEPQDGRHAVYALSSRRNSDLYMLMSAYAKGFNARAGV